MMELGVCVCTINKIAVKYRFLIPRLDDMVDMMLGATIIFKINLKNGYYQICICPENELETPLKPRKGYTNG